MWSLKIFSAVVLLSCWVWCSQAKEQAEVHIITEQDLNGSIESRTKFVDGLRREAKRQKDKSPNVHIENIYIPHQIQKGDETFHDYPSYPLYTYPLSTHAYTQFVETASKPSYSQKQTKSKPSPTGTQLPDRYALKSSQIPRQPSIIYGQTYPEQGNAYISLPSSGIISQHPQISSAQSIEGYPYYVIVNSPHSLQGQQAKSMSQLTSQENEKDEEDGEPESEATTPKSKKMSYKATQPKSPRPQLRPSKSDDNMGLSIAKYLLGHPLYSANDMERSSQSNNEMLAIADEDSDVDEDEFDDEEGISGKYSGNIDRIAEDDNDCDEFKKIGDMLNRKQLSTKGNKLPVDFLFGPNRPSGKIDDRVALVFLRHSKRGRQLLVTGN